jgi:prolyl 4-hydroxylase
MARATMIPRAHGEAFNVLRYELGQKYNSHYDVFDPAEYGPQNSQRVFLFHSLSLNKWSMSPLEYQTNAF